MVENLLQDLQYCKYLDHPMIKTQNILYLNIVIFLEQRSFIN